MTNYSHTLCPRIMSAAPISSIQRVGPAGHTNGSLCRWNGAWWLASKTNGWPTRTYLSELDEQFRLVSTVDLGIRAPWAEGGYEDARLFVHNNKLLISFTGLRQLNGAWYGQMCMGGWSDNMGGFWASPITYYGSNPWEKNWQFFSRRGQLFCVYSPVPHRIHSVQLHNGRAALGPACQPTNADRYTLPRYARGGAPPVFHNGEWYHWYHVTDPSTDRWTYSVGLYTFEADPPFNIRRVAEWPVMSPPIGAGPKDVLFPVGAVFWDGHWKISMGVDDEETVVVNISDAEIERLLIRVPETKTLTSWGATGVPKGPDPKTPIEIVQTPLGPIQTREPGLDSKMMDEVGRRDEYRLGELARFYSPHRIWDLGCAVGQVSIYCRQLWPECTIVAVEADPVRAECARMNCPFAVVLNQRVGVEFTGSQVGREYVPPDLIVCDCEGGELPFFWQVEECDLARHLPVICGEWHLWSGRAALAGALGRTHYVFFSDPNPGTGPWHYFWAVRRDLCDDSVNGRALFKWVCNTLGKEKS